MRPKDKPRAMRLDAALKRHDTQVRPLPGISTTAARSVLVEQIVESLRRIEYIRFVRDQRFDAERANPSSAIFDPIRAATLRMREGDINEAFWLVFLSVHFGKHEKDGWRLVRDIYGALGGATWTWARVSKSPERFRKWLFQNEPSFRSGELKRRFSNHRKYQSLSADSKVGTGAVIESYVRWVDPPRTHQQLIQEAHKKVGQNPTVVFDCLYQSMDSVIGFGRLAKFDFLTMLGKLGLAPIEPGSAYLKGATGPVRGARLLLGGDVSADISASDLDAYLIELDSNLHVGMQVLEDSLCNWQKSPKKFISFRG